MIVDEASIVLPTESWMFLLQCKGIHDAWMLPTAAAEQNLPSGLDWLTRQGLIWTDGIKMVMDEMLDCLSFQIAYARWALDIRVGKEYCQLLSTLEGWLWLRTLNGDRISVLRVREPMNKIRDLLGELQGQFGLRTERSPLWIVEMDGAEVEKWLVENA